METEMTLRDLAADPLIAMIMRADGIDETQLTALLNSVTRQEVERLQQRLRKARADDFYSRLDGAREARLRPSPRLA